MEKQGLNTNSKRSGYLAHGLLFLLHQMQHMREKRMLRITQTQGASGETSLTLEGRLVGPWVAELKSAVTAARLSSASSVRLELSGVRFVDAEGLALILGLQDQGVRLRDASPFVRELLKTDGH